MFSLGQGIIHPYYSVALAPAIGALVGIGASILWTARAHWWARASAAAIVAVTGWWSYTLLRRTPSWNPWLAPTVLALSLAAAAAIALVPLGRRRLAQGAVALAIAAGLLGPAAYSIATAATPHSGALPTAGPRAHTTGFGAVPPRRGGLGGGVPSGGNAPPAAGPPAAPPAAACRPLAAAAGGRPATRPAASRAARASAASADC